MKNKYTKYLLLVLLCLASIPAQAARSIGYWYNTSGEIARSNYGECIRSIEWSSSNALPECESEMTRKVAKVEIDSDNDGVFDHKDLCQGTADGVKVDAVGCDLVVKEADSDNDLVADNKDKCQGTAAGVKVDADGCELNMDIDNDGIANAADNCPGTVAGTIVNIDGCELKVDISLDNVQFDLGVAQLSANSKIVLDNISQTLQENKHLAFEVAGHTDNTGDQQFNINLSSSRAQSVRQYLIEKGVSADRLTTRGYGSNMPIASNDTRDGRIQNRRVELALH